MRCGFLKNRQTRVMYMPQHLCRAIQVCQPSHSTLDLLCSYSCNASHLTIGPSRVSSVRGPGGRAPRSGFPGPRCWEAQSNQLIHERLSTCRLKLFACTPTSLGQVPGLVKSRSLSEAWQEHVVEHHAKAPEVRSRTRHEDEAAHLGHNMI